MVCFSFSPALAMQAHYAEGTLMSYGVKGDRQ